MEDSSPSSASILLVDQEQFILVAYKDGLERAGYRVAIATDGEAALKEMKQTVPDLVILELMVPKMNGFELLQAMRSDARLKSVPVLVLTNLSQPSDKAEADSLNITDFFIKSDVSLNDVLQRVNTILGYA